ncbi:MULTISPECIES: ROK family transcriptional regulator [Halomonas]|uniref:Xylose repressor n=1 Tax=Halomonas halophila TaxID=29573 RepID=A0ABQ0U854_9GAMM|nr:MULTISPECIES: ROK family transcriptional regulator [Halomonas]MDR5891162.1 ROK family transcriptional regulator [Halomonas salina]WJY07528.1 ROK family transcriptional regulator [Halomonas halophila]GEK74678.1 xylose repressor [Halomonas halophila]
MTITSNQHQAGDLHFLKRLNRSAILEMVRRNPGMTRADIATRAQLTKATVGGGVQTLLKQGWLVEGDLLKSSGGRPGRALHLNEHRHVLLGAEVSVHGLQVVACTLSGTTIHQRHVRMEPTAPETAAQALADLIREVIDHPELNDRQCLGLGVALPGPIAPDRPLLRLAPNLGWRDVRFLDLLRESLPGIAGLWLLDNEAKAAAFGELYFRTDKTPESLLYVSAGTGIGSGIVGGGHWPAVTRGIHGLAGEIGHTVLQPGGLYCHCGNRGCAETLVSGWALRAALGVGEEEDLVTNLLGRLEAPEVDLAIRRAGEALGTLLLNLYHTLDPAEIVLGGSLTRLGPPLLTPALDYFTANQNRLLGATQRLPLRIIEDSTFTAARGAAAEVLANTIHGPA